MPASLPGAALPPVVLPALEMCLWRKAPVSLGLSFLGSPGELVGCTCISRKPLRLLLSFRWSGRDKGQVSSLLMMVWWENQTLLGVGGPRQLPSMAQEKAVTQKIQAVLEWLCCQTCPLKFTLSNIIFMPGRRSTFLSRDRTPQDPRWDLSLRSCIFVQKPGSK